MDDHFQKMFSAPVQRRHEYEMPVDRDVVTSGAGAGFKRKREEAFDDEEDEEEAYRR